MKRDTVSPVTERPAVDYAHLPGEEHNPLMESTAHVDWGLVLLNSVRHTLAGTGHLVTSNVAFAPGDGQPHTAPDLMVIPAPPGVISVAMNLALTIRCPACASRFCLHRTLAPTYDDAAPGFWNSALARCTSSTRSARR